jgi:predicted MFS family arabinose efflux permease
MSGPVIGSIVYGFVGFANTFFVFAGILLACGIMVLFFLPNRLNDMSKVSEEEERKSSDVAS